MTGNQSISSQVLEAARNLTRRGTTPFTLDGLIREVQRTDPTRERSSIQPIVQGMTSNASGGPKSACGEVLYRVDRGWYELRETHDGPPPLPHAGHYDEVAREIPIESFETDPVAFMRTAYERKEALGELEETRKSRDQVIARYGHIFAPENLDSLTSEQFRSFLLYENNRHWKGIHRHQTVITSDMDPLRSTLRLLLDESLPIEERLDQIVRPGQANLVPGLGKAVFTPILLVVYPDLYGVWNSIAESAMKKLGMWPRFDRGSSFGQRYRVLNDMMIETAASIGTDLWTLDELWWAAEQMPELQSDDGGHTTRHIPRTYDTSVPPAPSDDQAFALERHLHDFLADNWDLTELGQEWEIFAEGGDLVGYEYPTGVGRIDILAKHREEPQWLVVELKRGQSTDQTVGQVSRYMGWVKTHLAGPGETVRGMVISQRGSKKLDYALMTVPNVEFRSYSIEFQLHNDGDSRSTPTGEEPPP